jgi:isoleucyl-tRNA synthetase
MAYDASKHEKEVLAFWDKEKIFERSVEERSKDAPYVFYDGPPFATGLPHYGHIVASVMKDVVPRYWTMKGKRVERVWGWDCHGLPIENIVEKELGTKSKQDIEAMGVAKFNELCRSKVLSYVSDWEKTMHRLGRWVDMKNAYRTMDKGYMESVWWVFSELWDKGFVYKGYRPMHICPRCETTLSQQEVSEGYKDIKDLSVTAQFKVTKSKSEVLSLDSDVYILAWTTTPWTLPGNVLLAVGADLEYSLVKLDGVHYVVAKELIMANFDGKEFEVVANFKGKELVGAEYEPLFPYYAESENSFRVVAADFVTTEDGTGVVHIAPGFGTDDYALSRKEGVPFVQHLGMDGKFHAEVTDFAGMHVKPSDDHMKTDIEIIKYLAHNGTLFAKKKYEHSYPHCWRCDTPLLNYATSSWFVDVTKVKQNALTQAEKINWSPAHIKEGRFGKWLEGARDWSISRQRFWASVIPVWECAACPEEKKYRVFGSASDLETASGQAVDDLHKHVVDEIVISCEHCSGDMRRVPDVLDTWFDSGSMPYAQIHYPFENKEIFEAGFPAEFIAEGQDQTRAWFYYLHILSTAIKGTPAYKNVIVNGIVLAEDGKKMSKKLQNYPDPMKVLEQYGADALRYYLASSPVMHAESLNFSEVGVREAYNKTVNSIANVLAFYEMYVGNGKLEIGSTATHVLDKWVLARLQVLVRDVTENMEAYQLAEAARPILDFISDLSQWYVRRSRDRFKGLTGEEDKAAALATLRHVLFVFSKVTAPFMPFMAEKIFLVVKPDGAADSVHLEMWPEVDDTFVDDAVLTEMETTRKVVEMGMSLRKESGNKVRQPLGELQILGVTLQFALLVVAAEELNIKSVVLGESAPADGEHVIKKEDGDITLFLNTEITDDLKKEGLSRELVRAINMLRKDQGLTIDDVATVTYEVADDVIKEVFDVYGEEIKKQTLVSSLEAGVGDVEVTVGGVVVKLSVVKE